jgi:hypothetical protein
MSSEELAKRQANAKSGEALAALAWLAVGIPILWGVWVTLTKAWVIFS